MRLKSYAQHEADSKGRIHSEKEHSFRGIYQRDRDRIIHSRAFRRLEYKTQVFVNHEGDHYRTRLTHTLEAAMISRTIARALGLNEDLSEAIALAHDIGHPPFGHQGEYILNDIMKDHGGFEHNKQGLRIVDELERKYPGFNGLNLTWEVREGIAKHSTTYDSQSVEKGEFGGKPSLEAQVVDLADEIAYTTHDLDDGLFSELLSEEDLMNIELWTMFYDKIRRTQKGTHPELIKSYTIRCVINYLVEDLVKTTVERLGSIEIKTVEEVRAYNSKIVNFSDEILRRHTELKTFLYNRLYTNYHVMRLNKIARRILEELFMLYSNSPNQMGRDSRLKARHGDLHRVVCDYIAGMTDRYAFQEYKRFFGGLNPVF